MEKIKIFLNKSAIILILLVGIYIRVHFYFFNNVFETDECVLNLAMMQHNLWEMFLPLGPFSSSPIFMFFSKLLSDIFGYSTHALKLIPFLTSLASLFLFYKLAKKYFQKNISVLFSTFLISVNLSLIYYSATFKQYEIEAFLSILCLYFLPELDILKMNLKKLATAGLIISLIPLLSLPALFFIAAFFLFNTAKNIKNIEYYKKLPLLILPLILVFGVYYYFNLLPVKLLQYKFYAGFWNDIFSNSFIHTLQNFYLYVFSPNSFVILQLVLLAAYLFIIFRKQNRNKYDLYIAAVVVFSITASILHIYPIYERISVYLIPLCILVSLKLFDSIDAKNIKSTAAAFITIMAFCSYFTPTFALRMTRAEDYIVGTSPVVLINTISDRFNPKTDYVLANIGSASSFFFYANQRKLDMNKSAVIAHDWDNPEQSIYNFLNSLNPDNNYWFYMTEDCKHEREYIFNWLQYQNILFRLNKKESWLFYISGIKPLNKIQ